MCRFHRILYMIQMNEQEALLGFCLCSLKAEADFLCDDTIYAHEETSIKTYMGVINIKLKIDFSGKNWRELTYIKP